LPPPVSYATATAWTGQEVYGMVRKMCGMKLMDMKNTNELMDMLGLNETLDAMAVASGMRCLGHVLRRDESDVLRGALQFEVDGRRGRI